MKAALKVARKVVSLALILVRKTVGLLAASMA